MGHTCSQERKCNIEQMKLETEQMKLKIEQMNKDLAFNVISAIKKNSSEDIKIFSENGIYSFEIRNKYKFH
jgi:aspartate-semialdehyde dehydrogenase